MPFAARILCRSAIFAVFAVAALIMAACEDLEVADYNSEFRPVPTIERAPTARSAATVVTAPTAQLRNSRDSNKHLLRKSSKDSSKLLPLPKPKDSNRHRTSPSSKASLTMTKTTLAPTSSTNRRPRVHPTPQSGLQTSSKIRLIPQISRKSPQPAKPRWTECNSQVR